MLLIDTLAFLQTDHFKIEPIDIGDWELIRNSGIRAINQTMTSSSWESWVESVLKFTHYFDKHSDVVTKVLCSNDIERAQKKELFGVIFGSQRADYLGRDLGLLEKAYNHGLRIQQMCYNMRNYWGDGCAERTDSGLSHLGIQAIEKMNELGIMIDCAHTGEKTALETMKYSKTPVIISHCNMKAIYESPRNISDHLAIKCAEQGGVIGITWLSMFVGPKEDCSVDTLLRHIRHLINLIGIEHVCFGSDAPILGYKRRFVDEKTFFELERDYIKQENAGYLRYPPWVDHLDGPEAHKLLLEALESGGFTGDEIEKIMGLNFLRVFKEVIG
jgi:membrane dipeptidase